MNSFLLPFRRGLGPVSGLDSLELPRLKYWKVASLGHHLAVTALAVAALLHTSLGSDRYWMALGIGTAGLGLSIFIDAWTRATGQIHYQMMWIDQLFIGCVAMVFPRYWTIALMCGITVLAAEAILFPPRTAAVAAAIGAVALFASGEISAVQTTSLARGPIAYFLLGLVIAAVAATISVARLRSQEELLRFANIMENIPVGIYVFRLDEQTGGAEFTPSSVTLLSANPATESTTGINTSALIGHHFGELDYKIPQSEQFLSLLRRVNRTGNSVKVDITVNGNESQKGLRSGSYTLQVFRVGNSEVAISIEDITERVGAQDALIHQALHDAVTELPNRVQLHQKLVSALSLAERTGQAVSLLFIDINQFKEINDTLGHQFGDQLLRQVGERLQGLLSLTDTVARLGGDEFAVMRISQEGERTGVELTSKIHEALDPPFMLSGIPVRAGGSIGMVSFPDHGRDAETLLQRADIALYAAKRNGAGRATYSPDHSHFNIRRLTLLGELGSAIDRGEMVLHYQPKIDLRTGHTVGTEALVRWQHPRRGLLAPVHFIELAEISGLINQLTRWVAHESVRQVQSWRDAGHDLHLAANISVRNLHDYSLLDWLETLIGDSQFPPDRLILEITESAIIDELPIVEEMLHKVSALGVHMSVDDFGTGYSSLSTLRRLPVNEIKMDRSFVSNMISEEHDFAIVRSMVDLSHTLGISVTAEGVEDEETLNLLTDLGCDRTQGYFISRPLPPDDFKAWLSTQQEASVRTNGEGNGNGGLSGSYPAGTIPVTLRPAPIPSSLAGVGPDFGAVSAPGTGSESDLLGAAAAVGPAPAAPGTPSVPLGKESGKGPHEATAGDGTERPSTYEEHIRKSDPGGYL